MWLTLWDKSNPTLQWGTVITVSLVAAVRDVHRHRIPNALVFPVLIVGLGYAFAVGRWAGLTDASLAALLLSFPYVLLFLFARGGAGDAKLMAALGSWLGLMNGLIALLCVAVAGIVLGLSLALSRGRLLEVVRKVAYALWQAALSVLLLRRWSALADVPNQLRDSGRTQWMPYGLAICTGMLAAALGTWLWRR